uniref:Protein-serine O-palmitoleoyltransferase porcupine n=1 Tax=Salmo trutta TaxID=8032 RepID=A0A673ZY70_SALTR
MELSRIEFFQELGESCVLPTSQQGIEQVWQLLLLCRLLCRLGLSFSVKHLGSVAAGLYALYLFFEQSMVWCYCSVCSASLPCSSTATSLMLYDRELRMIDTVTWHKIRGSQMVVAMKGISLAFDLDRGTVPAVPNPLEFTGYILFVGTVVFGPWVSYSSYKEAIESHKLSLAWLQKFSVSWVKCQVCLVISNCIAPYLFPYFIPIHGGRGLWLHAYENAVSFHFSNYFVGHLSESTTVLAGVRFTEDNVKWGALNVELPRSMVLVVTSWNIPMSRWLNIYVFKNALKLGTFPSIIVTYTASALLHGLSFHLGAVLLASSLMWNMVKLLLSRLAAIFSACILSKQCPTDCRHNHQKVHACHIQDCLTPIYGINMTFSAMAIFDLTYLGSLFDADIENLAGYVANHTIQKWSELSWASHWLVFACWVFYRPIQ